MENRSSIFAGKIMNTKKLACVVLAGGQGTRMKSNLPKTMHKVAGLPMIGWILKALEALEPERIIVVTGPDMEDMADSILPHSVAVQPQALGTADAVKAALPALEGFDGDVLITLGDTPLLSAGILRGLVETQREGEDTGMAILGVEFDRDPPAFGRMILNEEDDSLARIVEDKDCTPEQRKIRLCNSGIFCVDGARLPGWIARIGNDNAKGEYYITDLPEIASTDGAKTRVTVLYDAESIMGINTRADLAVAEKAMQTRLREHAMANGATLIDPDTVYFCHDTVLGRDVVIEPGVYFGPGVVIADNVTIKASSHLEGAAIEPGAVIGPFARLRPGTQIGAGSKIGNFVEVKKSTLGKGVKAGHLAYIGDAEIGDHVNYSCGAITANYDGQEKHKTVVGAHAMIGSNVNLVAPLTIGAGAYIGAGSTITKDVSADALAVAREKPSIINGWAAKKRKGGAA